MLEDLKPIIAKNIANLRLAKGMTQLELAEHLNYSDKAVSKWERAESVPDIAVLKDIADLFEVSLDYLVEKEHEKKEPVLPMAEASGVRRNHAVITGMSILLVWLVMLFIFVVIELATIKINLHWLCFVYAVPVTMIVWLVFNSIWFNTRRNYMIISLLMWSTLIAIYLTCLAAGVNAWLIFVLGIPGQILIFMWSKLKYQKKQ